MKINLEPLENNYQLVRLNTELESSIKSQRKVLYNAFAPCLSDFAILDEIIAALEQTLVGCDKSTKNRVELFILLYLYCPIMLFYNSKKKGYNKEFSQVIRAIRLNYSNALKYRSSLLFFYRRYPAFRTLTDNAFAAISDIIAKATAATTPTDNSPNIIPPIP